MFNIIQDITKSFTELNNEQKEQDFYVYTNIVKRLDYSRFEKVLNIINGQANITKPEYSIYKYGLENNKFEHVADTYGDENAYHFEV